jgi:hypothetical protein
LAGEDPAGDLPPLDPSWGIVDGLKWEDLNGDGHRNEGEPGLPGVTIYADVNWNGALDDGEPHTVTQEDIPETDFDETGRYSLSEVPSGTQLIREVVPDGYVQTFPGRGGWAWPDEPPVPAEPEADRDADSDIGPDGEPIGDPPPSDEFAHVEPPLLELSFEPGTVVHQTVSIRIEPVCIRAIPLDVVASDPAIKLENLSGIQVNGCGGDVSRFDLAISVEHAPAKFEIQFIDSEANSVVATIPAFVVLPPHQDGGHVVDIVPGGGVGDIEFGNYQLPAGSIEGYKWLDSNANGKWDDGEQGLGGVVIYVDLDANGQFDWNEPSAVTEFENPDTDFDEGGRFYLSGLRSGEYLVREVLAPGFVQTFPAPGGLVHSSQTGRLNDGIALDLDLTGVAVVPNDETGQLDAQVDVTVVWPDSCGTLIDEDTAFTVVGRHIIVELSGRQAGEACLTVISPQVVSLRIPDLEPGRYEVVATLHESIPNGDPDLPTLTVVAGVSLGEAGAHKVVVNEDDPVTSGILFGNYGRIIDPPEDWMLADLDRDGRLTEADITLLALAIREGTSETGARDLSGDGQLDQLDLEYLVQDLLNTNFGDANMDGQFNSADLVQVFQMGEYEDPLEGNSTWADGDWNGDGEFNSSDLVLAMQHGGYERSRLTS